MKTRNTANWIGLIAGAVVIFLASFQSDILRDGNEPIAGFFALLGLFGIVLAVPQKNAATRTNPLAKIRTVVALEYLAIGALFGFVWVFAERDSFFAEGPSGKDLAQLTYILLIALAALVAFPIIIWNSTSPETRRQFSKPVWLAIGCTATVLVCLNFETRAETILIEDRGRVIIESQGFPFTAKRKVHVEPIKSTDSSTSQRLVITMPNGGHVEATEKKTIATRFRRTNELPPFSEVRFKDGTDILFEKEFFQFTVPHTPPIRVDLSYRSAAFVDRGKSYGNPRVMAANAAFAALLLAHAGWAVARTSCIKGHPSERSRPA